MNAVVFVVFCGVVQAADTPQPTSMIQSKMQARQASQAAQQSSSDLPRFTQLNKLVHQLLRQHAASKTETEKLANTLPVIHAANGLTADPRFATSPTLQELRGRLFARMRSIKRDTVKQLRREKKKPTTIQIDQAVLAQLNQAANPNAPQNNGAGLIDYGPQLIDLIQRTISPNLWDVNGGPSTIAYWRPGMALVVRAPQSVHREVNPLLNQLRQQ